MYLGAGMRFILVKLNLGVAVATIHGSPPSCAKPVSFAVCHCCAAFRFAYVGEVTAPKICKKMENTLANFIGRCYTIFMAVSFLYCRPDGLRFVLNRFKSQINKGTLKIKD